MTAASNLITLVLFAGLGYVFSRSLRPSRQLVLLLLLGAVAGGWIGVSTLLVSVSGFAVSLNWAIRGCCLGLLAGVVVRRYCVIAP